MPEGVDHWGLCPREERQWLREWLLLFAFGLKTREGIRDYIELRRLVSWGWDPTAGSLTPGELFGNRQIGVGPLELGQVGE